LSVSRISIFDVFKIGVGPSSSHTLGPWRAAIAFIKAETKIRNLKDVIEVKCILYGSLALTGKGHQTHKAVALGLSGLDPETCDQEMILQTLNEIKQTKTIKLANLFNITFSLEENIEYNLKEKIDVHANTMDLICYYKNDEHKYRYYSTGGGFIKSQQEEENITLLSKPPFPAQNAAELLEWCHKEKQNISKLIYENECFWHSKKGTENRIQKLWSVMQNGIMKGLNTEGILEGGLGVKRRAPTMLKKLCPDNQFNDFDKLIKHIKKNTYRNSEITQWVSLFALAINEENAAMGKIVTSPTNGAAGVIPAVLAYAICFEDADNYQKVIDYFCTAGEIGTLYIKEATISAAEGGCQAEIGVSSSMAAGALTEIMGGTPEQVLEAAEIAMEHHLGLTCDPVGGLVQIPCIERNAMGAAKAIVASQLALSRNPKDACVSLDTIIKTMWQTAQDMHVKYKETSTGGLALSVSARGC
jgi:L-serine dehydratase